MRAPALLLLSLLAACFGDSEIATRLPPAKTPIEFREVAAPRPMPAAAVEVVDPFGDLAKAAIASGEFAGLEERARWLLSEQSDDEKARELEDLYYPFYRWGREEDQDVANALDRWVERAPESPVARIARGNYRTGAARRARGGGWAKDVGEKEAASFLERAELAEGDFQEAARLEPGDPNAWSGLIELGTYVCAPREAIESYYERAVAAAPGHFGARIETLYYLAPRWCGSSNAMFEYALRMRDEEERHAAAALILPFALEEESNHPRLGLASGEQEYLKYAEPWEQILAATDAYFDAHPADLRKRFVLFEMAYRNERWDAAVEHANAIGNRWTPWFAGDTPEFWRKRAAAAYVSYGWPMREDPKALPFLERAAELEPDDAGYLYRAGWANMNAGRRAVAEGWFRRALAADPDHPGSFVGLIYVMSEARCAEIRELMAQPVRRRVGPEHAAFMKKVEQTCGIAPTAATPP